MSAPPGSIEPIGRPSRRNTQTDIEIVICDLVRSAALLEEVERNQPVLTDDERRKFAPEDGSEGLRIRRLARIALRLAIERASDGQCARRAFLIGATGKPRLPGAPPFFSHAHSGDVSLIAVSQLYDVGVDIEVPRAVTMTAERRARVIAAAQSLPSGGRSEDNAADRDVPADSDVAVLRAWVRLEALAKATGLGIGQVLSAAGVIGGRRDMPPGLFDGLIVRDIAVPGGHFAAIASQALPEAPLVTAFPAEDSELEGFLRPGSRC